VVTDFGLAKAVVAAERAAGENPASSVTASGHMIGTIAYMAPEQLRGNEATPASDIYALGLVMHEMVGGRLAFPDRPAPPSRLNVPPTLEEVISKALERDPSLRYQTAVDLLADLKRLTTGGASFVPAQEGRPQVPALNAAKGAPLQRGWLGAVAVLAVLIALGAVLYFRGNRRQPALTEKDTVLLADFTNQTGDAVFDDTLKQALAVALRQSPFLNALSNDQVAATLRLMERPAGTRVTGEVAREVCQRAGSRAYIAGSIAALGSQYVLGLKAVGCTGGETLAQEQATASGKEKVVNALGREAARLRSELGESLASVQKFDTPLEQATTSSLEALKAFSLARKITAEQGVAPAVPSYQRAIELDPSFAAAYTVLGTMYVNLGQTTRAREYLTKAFALRQRTSGPEELRITALYYAWVTGQLEQAEQTYQEWIGNYPRDYVPHVNLSLVRMQQGDYEKCAELLREALFFAPNNVIAYDDVGTCLTDLGRLDESRKIVEEARSRKLDSDGLHLNLYALPFLTGDVPGMTSQAAWFQGKPDLQHEILAAQADTEAYAGHLARARQLTRQAVNSAALAANPEAAAARGLHAALREAAFGNAVEARGKTNAALKRAPPSRDVEVLAALVYAWACDEGGARKLEGDLKKQFPLDTIVNSYWLPPSTRVWR